MLDVNKAYNQVLEKITGWLYALVGMIPNLILAVLVMVFFVLLSRLAQRIVRGLIKKFSAYYDMPVMFFFSNLTATVVTLTGIFIALGLLNLDKTVTSLLAGVGVVGLALGFAFQDIASNFMAGLVIIFRRTFREGDIVETNGKMGIVRAITLHSTMMHSGDGQEVYIPNREVFKGLVINYSRKGQRRLSIPLNIKHQNKPVEELLELLRSALTPQPFVIKEKAVEINLLQLTANDANLEIAFWIDYPLPVKKGEIQEDVFIKNLAAVRTQTLLILKKVLDQNNIALV